MAGLYGTPYQGGIDRSADVGYLCRFPPLRAGASLRALCMRIERQCACSDLRVRFTTKLRGIHYAA